MDLYYKTYCDYIQTILEQDLCVSGFKSHPSYTHMLESVTEAQGEEYENLILCEFGDEYEANKDKIIELTKINDAIGKPGLCEFESFGTCSPNNLRYIFQTLLILDHIKEKQIETINMIELGGGYGGLCFYLIKIGEMLGINIASYSIVDLEFPLKLQEKCLRYYSLPISVTLLSNIDYYDKLDKDYFFVSAYAIGEFSSEIRQDYVTHLLPKCSHGFAEWNLSPVQRFPVDLGHDGVKPYCVIPERPNFNIKSSFIYF